MRKCVAIGAFTNALLVVLLFVPAYQCSGKELPPCDANDKCPPTIIANVKHGDMFLVEQPPVILVSVSDDRSLQCDVRIFLDGQPYMLGLPVSSEGFHDLEVQAIDEAGNESWYTATFIVRRSPYFVFSARLADWSIVPFGQGAWVRAVFLIENDSRLYSTMRATVPFRATICEINDHTVSILLFNNKYELIGHIQPTMICEPILDNSDVIPYVFLISEFFIDNLSDLNCFFIVGSGNVGEVNEFNFGAEAKFLIDAYANLLWQTSFSQRRCSGSHDDNRRCRSRRHCDSPLPCRWVPQPLRGVDGIKSDSRHPEGCRDPISGDYHAYWNIYAEALKTWRISGWGVAYDRCLGTSVGNALLAKGRGDRIATHENPNDPRCYPCRQYASGLFKFGFSCRVERYAPNPLTVAIAAAAGAMTVSTPIGNESLVGGAQVGSSNPIELELGNGIKLKLTWSGSAPVQEKDFIVNKQVPERAIGGAINVSTYCSTYILVWVDGGSAILGYGEAKSKVYECFSDSYINARCDRGATITIRY